MIPVNRAYLPSNHFKGHYYDMCNIVDSYLRSSGSSNSVCKVTLQLPNIQHNVPKILLTRFSNQFQNYESKYSVFLTHQSLELGLQVLQDIFVIVFSSKTILFRIYSLFVGFCEQDRYFTNWLIYYINDWPQKNQDLWLNFSKERRSKLVVIKSVIK